MKCVQSERLDRPLFVHDRALRLLEQQLYGHVLAAIDFDRLARLETSLFGILVDTGMAEDRALDVSTGLLERALLRVVDDESRHCDLGPPPGITDAERRAVAFDETCPLCREDRAIDVPPATAGDGPDEPCPCCDDLAQIWRDQHADVLAKA